MMRRLVCLVCVTAMLVIVCGTAVAEPAQKVEPPLAPAPAPGVGPAVVTDDTFPGLWGNWYNPCILGIPWEGLLDSATDAYDIFRIYVETGETFTFYLAGDNPAADLDIFLYDNTAIVPGGATGLHESDALGDPTATITGTFDSQGTWYVVVHGHAGTSNYTLDADFSTANDNIPGAPIPVSGWGTYLHSYSDWDDVYKVWMNPGETITASIDRGSFFGGFDPELLLYGPGTSDIWDGAHNDYILMAQQSSFPKSISYTTTGSGWYYLDLYQNPFGSITEGEVYLDWSVQNPVYRFYNAKSGTHFYTATLAEKNQVIGALSGTYTFEGVSYNVNPYTNGAPLYRFFKPSTGTHFYTANETEKNNVVANLSGTYKLDGPAYNVSLAPVPGGLTVWRFFHKKNGTHFYTADPVERQNVQTNLAGTYTYEGPAFYVAP